MDIYKSNKFLFWFTIIVGLIDTGIIFWFINISNQRLYPRLRILIQEFRFSAR